MKVFITRKFPGEPEKILKAEGFDASVYQSEEPVPRNEFLNKCKNADAIITSLTDKVDKEALDTFTKCKVVANYAVGYNNIDVDYARKKKIIITNTPDVLTDATADVAASLILGCARRLREGEAIMRAADSINWKPSFLLGLELKNKTLGIIGAGRIGQATAKRMHGFGCKIIYFNRSKKENFEKEIGAKKVSLNTLLKNSDIVSVHLPLNEKTFHLLDEEKLKLLKPDSIIVNTSRGEVIEEMALIKLLKKKKIFGAGFDVYEGEPKINPELQKLDNVFLLPHIGSATIETRFAMSALCVQNVTNVLKGKKPVTPV
ncbi:MAG: D-glycerate dehydrogenase [Ignavibacteriales bacterium]|nr:D-glycerate dehydrogenase [Ignavibacteriales bacterium]